MAAICSAMSLKPSNLLEIRENFFKFHRNSLRPPFSVPNPAFPSIFSSFQGVFCISNPRKFMRVFAQAQEASVSTQDRSEESLRRLYVGNIPRTVDNSEITRIFGEYGSVEKAEVMYDKYSGRSRRFAFVTMHTIVDANAAIENLNGVEIGGRQIKVNITEKPQQVVDLSKNQAEESTFIDNPHKVYVGNLARTVTTDILTKFFSEKGKVLSAKVSRVPGTSKSSGFGFVTFSSEEDVEAAISSFNNSRLEGQQIRVNKA